MPLPPTVENTYRFSNDRKQKQNYICGLILNLTGINSLHVHYQFVPFIALKRNDNISESADMKGAEGHTYRSAEACFIVCANCTAAYWL